MNKMSQHPMIPVQAAVEVVLSHSLRSNEKRRLPVVNAVGRIPISDFVASHDFPMRSISVKDGYAVRARRTPGTFRLREPVYAGNSVPTDRASTTEAENDAHARYVATGAVVPDEYDCVVPMEEIEVLDDGNTIRVSRKCGVGAEIRLRGSDVAKGTSLVRSGRAMGAVEIGLLSMFGVEHVDVIENVVVGVLSTGNEIAKRRIFDVNKALLMCLLRDCAGSVRVVDLGVVDDDAQGSCASLDALVRRAASLGVSVVVSSGGVSVGEKDRINSYLSSHSSSGVEKKLWIGRLNLKPGMPFKFATFNVDSKRLLWFGLPGNPLSCLVTHALMVDPCLRALRGESGALNTSKLLLSNTSVVKGDRVRVEYKRAKSCISSTTVKAFDDPNVQQSSTLLSAIGADCLVVLQPGVTYTKGDLMDVVYLPNPNASSRSTTDDDGAAAPSNPSVEKLESTQKVHVTSTAKSMPRHKKEPSEASSFAQKLVYCAADLVAASSELSSVATRLGFGEGERTCVSRLTLQHLRDAKGGLLMVVCANDETYDGVERVCRGSTLKRAENAERALRGSRPTSILCVFDLKVDEVHTMIVAIDEKRSRLEGLASEAVELFRRFGGAE